jgi:Icc-related predicted phosphoesterase
MKINIISDLHLDMGKIMPDPLLGGELLILAGDIVEARALKRFDDAKYAEMAVTPDAQLSNKERINKWLMQECSKKYEKVIYVLGNHEYYHGTYEKTLAHAKDNVPDNFQVLEQDNVTIGDTLFLCGTLWTDMNRGDPLTKQSLKYSMNDFMCVRTIRGGNYVPFAPADAEAIHHNTLRYFKTVLDLPINADKKVVVVTHHAPTGLSISPKFAGEFLMNGGFASRLDDFILDNPRIKLWIHGHTHTPFNYMVGDDTRVICNPRGYVTQSYDEATGWDPHLFIEV